MADLTDFTITPMIPIGIGISISHLRHSTDLSFPLVIAVGVVEGSLLGFCFGLFLTILVGSLLELGLKVREKRKENKIHLPPKDTYNERLSAFT